MVFIFYSCKSDKSEKISTNEKEEVKIPIIENYLDVKINYNDTVSFPRNTEDDSGYFKGYIPEKIDSLETVSRKTHLIDFIKNNISKKDISLLNRETLSHSVNINQKTKVRIDTYKNQDLHIISVYYFGDHESQKITFNGKVVKNYKWNGIDESQEDILIFNERSFRYFSFNGNKYYYLDAKLPHTGGSVDNIYYQCMYSFKSKKLNTFSSCRFGHIFLFGDIDGDKHLDFLNFNNGDFCTLVPGSTRATFNLYSYDEEGILALQKDKRDKIYFIDFNSGESLAQDSCIIQNYYWPVKLK